MKNHSLFAIMVFASYSSLATAATVLEIDIKNELDLKDGAYLAKEYGGQGRYAFINHSHGRFEGGDIAEAACTDGFLVSQLPAKFSKIKKTLKPTDYVLTKCDEAK
jgi:hypothetical protein